MFREQNPLGQINMRDARVEEVEHVSDSDSEEREDLSRRQAHLTVAIYPENQGPTYLILPGKQERDNWLYHLTVVSGGRPNAGTQYEQLVQKLMETDGDSSEIDGHSPLSPTYRSRSCDFFSCRLRPVATPHIATHEGANHVSNVLTPIGIVAMRSD